MLILGTTKVPVFFSFVNLISAARYELGMESQLIDFFAFAKVLDFDNEKLISSLQMYILSLILPGGFSYTVFFRQ